LIDIGLRAVLSSPRIGWRMSGRNIALEAGRHYKLTSVSLVLLKGRSVRLDIPISGECHFNME
jgi:hypothetical protein